MAGISEIGVGFSWHKDKPTLEANGLACGMTGHRQQRQVFRTSLLGPRLDPTGPMWQLERGDACKQDANQVRNIIAFAVHELMKKAHKQAPGSGETQGARQHLCQ